MDDGKIHIDDLYRDKQEPFVPLPATAWGQMEQKLVDDNPQPSIWGRWWLYALATLLIIAIALYLNHHNTPVTPAVPANPSGRTLPGNTDAQKYDAKKTTAPDTQKASYIHLPGAPGADTQDTILATGMVAQQTRKAVKTGTYQKKIAANYALGNAKSSHPREIAATPPTHQRSGKIGGDETGTSPATPAQTINNIAAPGSASVANDSNIQITSSAQPTPSKADMGMEISKTLSTTADSMASSTNLMAQLAHTNMVNDTPVNKSKPHTPLKFTVGVRIGIESGTGHITMHKVLVSPYLQIQLNKKISITLQPALKYTQAANIPLPANGQYYSATGTTIDSQTIIKNSQPFWQITYTHNYDSILISYKKPANSFEADLPVVIRYHLNNKLSLGVGALISVGRLATIETITTTVKSNETAVFTIEKKGVHPPPDTSNSFHHTIQPYSAYTPLTTYSLNPVRMGYCFTLGYTLHRFEVQAMLQQNISGYKGISEQNIKTIYRQPYISLSVGYKMGHKK